VIHRAGNRGGLHIVVFFMMRKGHIPGKVLRLELVVIGSRPRKILSSCCFGNSVQRSEIEIEDADMPISVAQNSDHRSVHAKTPSSPHLRIILIIVPISSTTDLQSFRHDRISKNGRFHRYLPTLQIVAVTELQISAI